MQTSFDFNPAKPLPEVKELKVSELSNLIKKCIEDNFGTIRVKGEVSGLKIASSGHGYFNLKDQDAVLACTCWRPVLAKLPFQLKDGMEIIATGKLTTYGGQSRYQLNVERIETAGIGALMQILQDRKEKLTKEGLFDPARKKPLPFFPKKIGIITSPTGAVIQDILHRISDRCPTHILLWPVAVQGESSAFEVSSAINGFNYLSDEQKPDLIIVARGGGSIEDLWSFNEEIVVRATANSKIPIISAVGHETDITLIDFAADRRAPTPTAAAEFAVPVLSDLSFTVKNLALRVENTIFNLIRHQSTKLEVSNQFFKDPNRLLFQRQQRLDELSFRLSTSLPNNINMKSTKLDALRLPATVLKQLIAKKETLLNNTINLHNIAIKNYLNNKSQKLSLYDNLLNSLDIKQILKRGFTIIKTTDGQVIDSASKIPDQNFTIEWHDGTTEVKKVR